MFDKILIVDTIEPFEHFTKPEEKIFRQCINPKYWEISKAKKCKNETKKRYRAVIIMRDILEKYGLNKTQKEVRKLLILKIEKLLSVENVEAIANIRSSELSILVQNGFEQNRKYNTPKEQKKWAICPHLENQQNSGIEQKSGRFVQRIIVDKQDIPNIQRACEITGVDISHQRADSLYISTGTVLRIKRVDPILFLHLEYLYSPEIKCESIFKYCELISHNIRNIKSNQFRKRRKEKVDYTNSLFPHFANEKRAYATESIRNELIGVNDFLDMRKKRSSGELEEKNIPIATRKFIRVSQAKINSIIEKMDTKKENQISINNI